MKVSRTELNNKFYSKTSTGSLEFGSYMHNYFMVNINSKVNEINAFEDFNRKSKIKFQDETLVNEALVQSSYFHEYKHYYDCFSTRAGISLFGTYLLQLREFIDVVKYLVKNNLKWQLPLQNWVKNNNCPDIVKKFYADATERKFLNDFYMGGQIISYEEQHSDEVYRNLQIPQFYKYNIPLYPIVSQTNMLDSHGNIINKFNNTHWSMVGFEALLEGNAQAFQRSIIENMCGNEVAEEVWKRFLLSKETFDNSEFDVKSYSQNLEFQQYNITDYFITKYLRSKYGIKTFSRNLVTSITDNALNESLFPDKIIRDNMIHPGTAFLENLHSSDLKNENVRESFLTKEKLKDFIKSLKDSAIDPLTVNPREVKGINLDHMITLIEGYVQHHIVCPLLEIRLNNGNENINTLEHFIKNFDFFPKPVITVYKDGNDYNDNLGTLMKSVWASYVTVVSIMNQILRGQNILVCPKFKGLIAGLSHIGLSKDVETCEELISKRNCGYFGNGDNENSLPQCLNTEILKALSLF